MGFENMRAGYGRFPPLIAVFLVILCVVLLMHWWSLSVENRDLLKQLDDLAEQLRISSYEQDVCSRQKQTKDTRIKSVEDELAKLKVRIDEITTENDDLKKAVETKEEELKTSQKNKEEVQGNADLCNTELDSLKKLDLSKDGTISSLRDAKDRVSTELKELKQTVEQLRTELTKTKEELSNFKAGKQSSIPSVKAISEQPVTQFDDNIAIGGNHELEIEDNNDAKEEPDEAEAAETNPENPDNPENPENAENQDANQMGEGEPRMDMGEEEAAPA